MKTGIIHAAVILGLLVVSATAQTPATKKLSGSAAPGAPLRMPTYHVRADVPTAIHIIEPKLQTDYAGQTVEMKFTVDKDGQAYNIGVTNQNVDPNLAVQLAQTIQLWKFEPARDAENKPMERTVILPVIIDEPVAAQKAPAAAAKASLAPTPKSAPVVKMAPYRVRADVPTAVNVIVPRISTNYSGRTVELKFTVDSDGRPYNVAAVDLGVDPSLITQLAAAVSHWRFDPAHDSTGKAMDREVILPITID